MTLRPIQFVYLVVPVGLLLTALLNLYAFFHRRSDIWWTPLPKAVPVAASGDRVEIFARGTDLRTLLDAGRVRVTGDPGAGVLAADDVRIRFNNWDRVRAEQAPLLVLYGFTIGAALVLVGLTLTGHVPKRRPSTA
ncbi:MAG: hypothetical protein DMD37_12170 [Gemmatimonadetes bacterium]|nr:MAG: hypothetical protein DMD71_01620 [Gemmatimonadota bacterium]PYO81910.1 MAG: hypothetical protein DMD68_12605 [Gemmatimonadota bacterium]PYP61880.1 MAG: hypothetical protein DMD37_12170 [Gemmatimonadota bacterium]